MVGSLSHKSLALAGWARHQSQASGARLLSPPAHSKEKVMEENTDECTNPLRD